MSKFIIFDTETTGFYEEDRIIEVGAMILDDKGEVQILDELCSTDIPIKMEATLIHKITQDMIEDKRVAKHLLAENKSKALPYLRYSLKLYENEENEATKYAVEMKEHTAIGDVLVTKLLFEKLQILTKEKFPNDNPIEKMQEFTKTPILLTFFKFGKYKGKKISDIYKSDIAYINWMKKNIDLDIDMKFTFDKLQT